MAPPSEPHGRFFAALDERGGLQFSKPSVRSFKAANMTANIRYKSRIPVKTGMQSIYLLCTGRYVFIVDCSLMAVSCFSLLNSMDVGLHPCTCVSHFHPSTHQMANRGRHGGKRNLKCLIVSFLAAVWGGCSYQVLGRMWLHYVCCTASFASTIRWQCSKMSDYDGFQLLRALFVERYTVV